MYYKIIPKYLQHSMIPNKITDNVTSIKRVYKHNHYIFSYRYM